jgi:hypothetical protein
MNPPEEPVVRLEWHRLNRARGARRTGLKKMSA